MQYTCRGAHIVYSIRVGGCFWCFLDMRRTNDHNIQNPEHRKVQSIVVGADTEPAIPIFPPFFSLMDAAAQDDFRRIVLEPRIPPAAGDVGRTARARAGAGDQRRGAQAGHYR